MDEVMFQMWLSRVNLISFKKFQLLLEHFGNARSVFSASKLELQAVEYLGEKAIDNLIKDQDDKLIDAYAKELEEKNIQYISIFDEQYPVNLNDIPTPPKGIYIIGELPSNDLPKISVIGSRRCSEYGTSTAHKLSLDLARHGVVIVSGLARGIDSSAHEGALESEGLTIAVLASGVDICYPSENRGLKKRIEESGCVMSEYPPSTPPLPAYFPCRNRIISGLSRATIVVEAAKRSGTLITVDQALEQGRDVYAVPGNVTSKLSQGTNDFIKQGATLIADYEDVLNNLHIPYDKKAVVIAHIRKTENLMPIQRLVYNMISTEPVDVDEIVLKTTLTIQKVNSILVMLELDDLVKKLPGQRYIRC